MGATNGAGQLRTLTTFAELTEVDDGRGNVTTDWLVRARASASIHYLRGSETVMQGRLQGVQTAIITVRSTAVLRAATTAWRLTDADGTAWNIRSISDPTGRKAWLEILAERGVAI